jgi:TonB family protein
MTETLRSWQLSFLIHAGAGVIFMALIALSPPAPERIEVPVVIAEPPREVQNLAEVKEKPSVVLKSVNEPQPAAKAGREVFGINRDAHTDDSVLDREAVSAKRGNTLTKASDQEVLRDDDPSALPEPTEEYLVSEMPAVLSEVRPAYPPEARARQQEGAVIMDILVDDKGAVRQVDVIDGDPIFRPGAVEAMRRFRFRPAKVDGSPVAVRIRYTLRFELEF